VIWLVCRAFDSWTYQPNFGSGKAAVTVEAAVCLPVLVWILWSHTHPVT